MPRGDWVFLCLASTSKQRLGEWLPFHFKAWSGENALWDAELKLEFMSVLQLDFCNHPPLFRRLKTGDNSISSTALTRINFKQVEISAAVEVVVLFYRVGHPLFISWDDPP